MSKNKSITTFDEHLDRRYGKRGAVKRTDFEIKATAFLIYEEGKEARRLANFTQDRHSKENLKK